MEKEMETHSNILAWRIPSTGRLQTIESQRIRHNRSNLAHSTHLGREQQGEGTQENCSATWLKVSDFMVIGLVSRLSLLAISWAGISSHHLAPPKSFFLASILAEQGVHHQEGP